MQRNVLVTGGAGFIGSHLVDRLVAEGDRVIVLDDLSSGSRANLPDGVQLVVGDVTCPDDIAALLQGVDCIFHLAARVSVQMCIGDWLAAHRVNLGGAVAVLLAAQRAGNVPVIYASSAAVYGNRSGVRCRETDLPLPISPYGADKLGCEHQARAMAELHGLRSVGLRFFNVYGPRQDAASPYAGVISRFCANRRAGRAHDIYGDGLQSRDFIYVGDVVQGLCDARAWVMDPVMARDGAHVLNLCTGTETTLLDLAAQIDRVAGQGVTPITHHAARGGDIRASCGCPDAARAALGFAARTDVATGLRALWQAQNGAGL